MPEYTSPATAPVGLTAIGIFPRRLRGSRIWSDTRFLAWPTSHDFGPVTPLPADRGNHARWDAPGAATTTLTPGCSYATLNAKIGRKYIIVESAWSGGTYADGQVSSPAPWDPGGYTAHEVGAAMRRGMTCA